jgi:hypothetical protein
MSVVEEKNSIEQKLKAEVEVLQAKVGVILLHVKSSMY